jgi:replicative DNA helicase
MIVKLERRVIAACLLQGRLPEVDLYVDDFIDATHRQIYAAMVALAAADRPLSTVAVWEHDPTIDPADLCESVGALVMDETAFGFLLDAYALALATIARRRTGKAAA